MKLKSAHIKNFRSLRDVTVNFSSQTAIVGANGAGKSTILKAIDRFYGSSSQVALDDFHGRNVDEPIEIALTFFYFSSDEVSLFGSRIQQNEMTVVRVFEAKGGKNSGKYFGMTRGHIGFASVRGADNATAQRKAYADLRNSDSMFYASLQPVAKAPDIEPQLAAWETANPGACEAIRDDGQFLGFTNVGNGSLKKATSFVYIPAVRDAASDAVDGRGSAIARLMELVVRSAIQKRAEIQTWQAQVSLQYRELTDPAKLTELNDLAAELTKSLKTLYDETAVDLTWKPSADLEIPLPTAIVALEDAGFPAPVELQGNGLQRAFILTLLQHLAMAVLRDTATAAEPGGPGVIPQITANIPVVPLIPGLILAIEEPELYQHPTKQRHFAKVLGLLSDGTLPGVATNTQVIFASHSPYFVCMDRFHEVKLARRFPSAAGTHKECLLEEAALQKVVDMLAQAHQVNDGSYTVSSLQSKLHIVTPELSEGFFADVVLLVEGESDKAAIRAAASLKKIDLEALGIAVLQAGGKNNLDRPAAIFCTLGIPTFVVWDCDRKDSGVIDDEKANRALQRLLGTTDAEVFAAGSRTTHRYACFEKNLECMLRTEFGESAFGEVMTQIQEDFGVKERKDAIKASPIMRAALVKLSERGLHSPTLDTILERAVALRNQGPSAQVPLTA